MLVFEMGVGRYEILDSTKILIAKSPALFYKYKRDELTCNKNVLPYYTKEI